MSTHSSHESEVMETNDKTRGHSNSPRMSETKTWIVMFVWMPPFSAMTNSCGSSDLPEIHLANKKRGMK